MIGPNPIAFAKMPNVNEEMGSVSGPIYPLEFGPDVNEIIEVWSDNQIDGGRGELVANRNGEENEKYNKKAKEMEVSSEDKESNDEVTVESHAA